MSFASSLGSTTKVGGTVLRGASLVAMGRTVGVVVAAGLLAAIYQTASDESRTLLNTIRARKRYLQARHDTVLLGLLGTELDSEIQQDLLYARDAYKYAIALLADPTITTRERHLVRQALFQACNTRE